VDVNFNDRFSVIYRVGDRNKIMKNSTQGLAYGRYSVRCYTQASGLPTIVI